MGYRDDFYKVKNIIGYTGDLGKSPTVYFMNDDEYGRITQGHKNPKNIGRNKVRSRKNYEYANELEKGKIRMVEYLNGKKLHVSRNMFIDISDNRDATIPILARAIFSFPNIKEKSYQEGMEIHIPQLSEV
jgi:hypothetical protein